MIKRIYAFGVEDINQIESELTTKGVVTTQFENITDILSTGASLSIVDLFFFIAGGVFTVYFLYAGIMLMTSSGEPKKVADAKQTLTNALIGLMVVIFAYWIVQFLGLFLGLDNVSNTFSS